MSVIKSSVFTRAL